MKSARQAELEVVGTYEIPHEALVAKATLEAFGVPGWVHDETQIRFKAYMGGSVGGVKLLVRTADAETAREILAGDHSSDLAAVPESRLPPSADELCPRCGAELVGFSRSRTRGLFPKWLRVFASSLLAGGASRAERAAARCAACGHVER